MQGLKTLKTLKTLRNAANLSKAKHINVLSGIGGGPLSGYDEMSWIPEFVRPAISKLTSRFGLFDDPSAHISKHIGKNYRYFDTDELHNLSARQLRAKYPELYAKDAININLGTPISRTVPTIGSPIRSTRASKDMENKYIEAQRMLGILPETQDIKLFAKAHNIDLKSPGAAAALKAALKQQYGSNYFLKPKISYQSNAATFPTARSRPETLMHALQQGVQNNEGKVIGRNFNWIVQPKMDVLSPTLADRTLTRVADAAGMYTGTGAREYRVHTIGKNVIPYASVYRGGGRQVLPWVTKEQLMVEKQMQKLLNEKLDKRFDDTPFGFDVLIGKGGKMQIRPIESNPATVEGSSGLAWYPHVQDAIASYAAGKLPMYVQRQRMLENTARNTLATAPGLVASGLRVNDSLNNNSNYLVN
jgi:hypothetical protein